MDSRVSQVGQNVRKPGDGDNWGQFGELREV